jgi:hypothetical protein
MRRIAVVSDYRELVAALRARAEALDVSNLVLDDITGLASGHTGKLLSLYPKRTLGRVSLGALLAALGVKLVVIEDPEALDRVKGRLTQRAPQGPRRGGALLAEGDGSQPIVR